MPGFVSTHYFQTQLRYAKKHCWWAAEYSCLNQMQLLDEKGVSKYSYYRHSNMVASCTRCATRFGAILVSGRESEGCKAATR